MKSWKSGKNRGKRNRFFFNYRKQRYVSKNTIQWNVRCWTKWVTLMVDKKISYFLNYYNNKSYLLKNSVKFPLSFSWGYSNEKQASRIKNSWIVNGEKRTVGHFYGNFIILKMLRVASEISVVKIKNKDAESQRALMNEKNSKW